MLRSHIISFAVLASALAACGAAQPATESEAFKTQRCVNMGNALEAPKEGEWGHKIDLDNFARIREAGFDTVRFPVRWDAHLAANNLIDPTFLNRVDQVLDAALAADLDVVLNVHHFDDLMEQPERYSGTLLDIWEQLAYHYQDLPDRVSFEVLNEPSLALNGTLLRRLQGDAVRIIRSTNPTRTLILGGENWSGLNTLGTNVKLNDPNVVYTFHYYDPFDFTHQKAPWTGPDGPKETRTWGSESDHQKVQVDMASAKRFSEDVGRKVFLGEFGAYEAAPEDSRLAYMSAVRREAEAAGIGWCVWNFTSSFPLFDDDTKTWVPGQLEALDLGAP